MVRLDHEIERLACQIESASPSGSDHLLAHIIRQGHLEQMADLIGYAKAQRLDPPDLIWALFESLSIDLISFMDCAELDLELDPSHLATAFREIFAHVLAKAQVARKLGL